MKRTRTNNSTKINSFSGSTICRVLPIVKKIRLKIKTWILKFKFSLWVLIEFSFEIRRLTFHCYPIIVQKKSQNPTLIDNVPNLGHLRIRVGWWDISRLHHKVFTSVLFVSHYIYHSWHICPNNTAPQYKQRLKELIFNR